MRDHLLILALLCTTLLPAQELALDTVHVSEPKDTHVRDRDSVAVTEESLILSQETDSLEPILATTDCVKLYRIRGTYYLGDDPLTRKEYRDFLRVNAPDLYNRYRTGNALWATGWTLLGVSTAAFFFSGVCLVAGLFETVVAAMFGASSHVLLSTGLIIMGSSVALNVGSIPCLIYGGIYKFSINRLYNERCERQQTTLEISLQTSQNGIGFSLKF